MNRLLSLDLFSFMRRSMALFALKLAGDQAALNLVRVTAEGERPQWRDLSVFEAQVKDFERSTWVYTAVDRVATDCSMVALNAMLLDGEDKSPLLNHPVEQLFRRPNSWQSEYELKYTLFAYWLLTGNAYLFMNLNEGDLPTELISLRPDRVSIVPGSDTTQFVKGYLYEVNGVQVPLDGPSVIHFKKFHPRSDYYGLSPLMAARYVVETDVNEQLYNYNYFGRENGIPSGLVIFKNPVPDSTFEQAKHDWVSNYGGAQRKTAFIRGAEMGYQPLSLSQRDMDFLASRKFNKEEIFNLFGVYLGQYSENATEANATAAKELYTANTVWSNMTMFCQKLTAQLAPLYGSDIIIEPDDIRIKDQKAEMDEIRTAANFLVINEIRQKYYHLDPRADGEIYAAGAGAVAITGGGGAFGAIPKPDMVRQTPQLQAESQQEASAEMADMMPAPAKVYISPSGRRELEQFARFAAKRLDGRREQIDHFAFNHVPEVIVQAVKAFVDVCEDEHELAAIEELTERDLIDNAIKAGNDSADAFAQIRSSGQKLLSAAVAKYLAKLQADILSGIRHVGANPRALQSYFNARYWADTQKEMSAALIPIYADLVDRAAIQQATRLDTLYSLPVDPAALARVANEMALEWSQTAVPGLVATTRDGLLALLDRVSVQLVPIKGGPEDRNWLQQLIDAIGNSPLFALARAAVIAVTEVARAIGSGALAAIGLATGDGQQVPLQYDPTTAMAMIPLHGKCDCYWEEQPIYQHGKLVGMGLVWRHPRTSNDAQCQRCIDRQDQTYEDIMQMNQPAHAEAQ